MADGLHLGPVGGRIVAEVFIGLLQSDPTAYLAAKPAWTPSLPSKTGTVRDDRLPDLRRRRSRVPGTVTAQSPRPKTELSIT